MQNSHHQGERPVNDAKKTTVQERHPGGIFMFHLIATHA
jgi:hypothetical protein